MFYLPFNHSRRMFRTLICTAAGSFERSRLAPLNHPAGSAKTTCCSMNIAPAGSWNWCWYGKAAQAIGEIDEARRAYRRAIELETSDLSDEESAAYGELVGELFGFGAGDDRGTAGRPRPAAAAVAQNGSLLDSAEVWFLADVIPTGTAAAVVLLEHRWAIPLRDAVEAADGHDLIDTWVHRRDLARRD